MSYAKTVFPLALIMFLVGADEYILSSILAPMGDAFGVAPARITLLVSAYALPCAVLSLPFGALSDRWGRKRVLLPSLAIFTLATFCTGIGSSFTFALICRFIAGSAAAALGPNAFALAGDLIPLERRPEAMGHTMLGLTIGLIASPAIGGWITEVFGWRWAFAFLGTCCLGAMAGVAIGVPHQEPAVSHDAPPGFASYLRALTLPGVGYGVATQGLWIGITIGTLSIVGEIFRTRYDLSIAQTGMTLASFGVLTIAGNLMVSRAVAWTGSTRGAVLVAVVATWLGIGGLSLMPSVPFAVTLVSFWVWAVFAGFGGPALQALLADLAGEGRGTVMSSGASAMHFGVVTMTFLEAWIFPQFGSVGIGVAACSLIGMSFFTAYWARPSGSTS